MSISRLSFDVARDHVSIRQNATACTLVHTPLVIGTAAIDNGGCYRNAHGLECLTDMRRRRAAVALSARLNDMGNLLEAHDVAFDVHFYGARKMKLVLRLLH